MLDSHQRQNSPASPKAWRGALWVGAGVAAVLLLGWWRLWGAAADPVPSNPADGPANPVSSAATGAAPGQAAPPLSLPAGTSAHRPADGTAGPGAPLGSDPAPGALGSPPDQMPQAVPLGRDTRNPAAAAALVVQQQADQQRQLADSSAPRPDQRLAAAQVRASDVGVAFLPHARQDAQQSTRTGEPGYGETVSTRLVAKTSLDEALAFYRRDLQARWPGGALAEARPGAGFATLDLAAADTRVSVLVQAVDAGQVQVTLTRWVPDRAAAATAAARASGP